ncbi:hypothetical protein TNCV_2838731 [Trichonephila clavipes]|nr:hypothetical protein TNCV_2838731 [Trichonephila clavipes]
MSSSQSDFTQSHAYGLKVNDNISQSFIHNDTYTKMVSFLLTAVVQCSLFYPMKDYYHIINVQPSVKKKTEKEFCNPKEVIQTVPINVMNKQNFQRKEVGVRHMKFTLEEANTYPNLFQLSYK